MERTDAIHPNQIARAHFTKLAGSEPIPGYRLLAPLGKGGFGEVWSCEAPGGLRKAIKFVPGNAGGLDDHGAPADDEWQAVQHVKAIRHPFLLSIERVENIDGELVIVTELADRSLHDLLLDYQRRGAVGIPRGELLNYMAEAAEALDIMNLHHGLQHLDIKPRNLFLVSHHVKVADFGLVNRLNAVGGIRLGSVTPLYASPETFEGHLSPQSDQYSLAIVYCELLTGVPPIQGKNARQLLMQHTSVEPDLSGLPELDRATVARALAKVPGDRFPSCRAFICALRDAGGTNGSSSQSEIDTTTLHDLDLSLRDTRRTADSAVWRDLLVPGWEALAGCKVIECQNRSPLTESWKIQTPEGRVRLAKVIYGFARHPDAGEVEVVATVKSLRHPGLIPLEVVQSNPGRLLLLTDSPDRTLRDRLQECQTQGLPGIPRRELLGHLRRAATILHDISQKHGLQHLGLNPRNLVLEGGRIRLANYGLMALLWFPSGQAIGRLNARYAAPELFEKQMGPNCDQYSLGLLWTELLTGVPSPHGSGNSRSRPLHDLSRLPPEDQAVVARALDIDPEKRWPSCPDFIAALERAAAHADTLESLEQQHPRHILNQLLAELANAVDAEDLEDGAPVIPGTKVLQVRFSANLDAAAEHAGLEALRQQWNGQLLREHEGQYVFRVTVPSNFWRRCIGRQPGLKVLIRLSRPQVPGATATEITIQVRPHACTPEQGEQLLSQTGPLLFDSARACLGANPRRRAQERLAWHQPVVVRPIFEDGSLGDAVACQGKDISASGIGFYLPRELPTAQINIDLTPTPLSPGISLPASIVRVQRCGDSWFEVGALFVLPSLRTATRSDPEFVLRGLPGTP